MSGLFSRISARAATGLTVLALAAGMALSAPTQAKASTLAGLAVGGAIVGIVLGGAKKPKYEVIARYCYSHKTGLYHRCY